MELNARHQDSNKIIKAFCVVGINESKPTYYKEPEAQMFIHNIDMIEKEIPIKTDQIEKENEKWYISVYIHIHPYI